MSSKIFTRIAAFLLALAILPATLSAQAFDKGPELDKSKEYYALIVTSMGNVALKLYAEEAPITVRNFVNLAEGTASFKDPKTSETTKRPYFNGVLFHRVIGGFMVQTGDPMGTGQGGPGFTIQDEFRPALTFAEPGVLAMANTGRPSSGGSQFFITDVPTPHLNQKHTIFGKIVDGTDGLAIVKKITAAPQGANNRPMKDIRMERVQIFRLEKGLPASDAAARILGGAAATPEPTKPAEPEAAAEPTTAAPTTAAP